MKRISILAMALAVGVAAGCEGPADGPPAVAEEPPAAGEPKPPAAEGKDIPAAMTELMKERNQLHKRTIGALLTIAARWEMRPQGGPVPSQGLAVVIDWQIDYDGPRHPFTVLKPSLFPQAFRQTAIHFWYLDAVERPVPFQIAAGAIAGTWPIRKEYYSVAEGDKPVAGQLVVYEDSLAQVAGRRFGPGDVLLVQLEHAPRARGEGLGQTGTLDAWTGPLWSPVVVAVK